MELEHSTIETNGIKLHVVQAGPKSGIPVVLLHGFPEFWYGWRNQIPALVEAGCRVIVPDQRGYIHPMRRILEDCIRMDNRGKDYEKVSNCYFVFVPIELFIQSSGYTNFTPGNNPTYIQSAAN